MHGPFGKIEPTVPLERGGTAGTSAQEARDNLDVPSLGGNNTFSGTNTFNGQSVFAYSVLMNSDLEVAGVSQLGYVEMGPPTWNSGFYLGYVAKTADYTIGPGGLGIVNCTSGSFTVTLPTAMGVTGRLHIIKNSGAGTITLATTGGQTIDGGAPGTVAAGAVIRLVSDGAGWITI